MAEVIRLFRHRGAAFLAPAPTLAPAPQPPRPPKAPRRVQRPEDPQRNLFSKWDLPAVFTATPRTEATVAQAPPLALDEASPADVAPIAEAGETPDGGGSDVLEASCRFVLCAIQQQLGFVEITPAYLGAAIRLTVLAVRGAVKVSLPGKYIINRRSVRSTAQAWVDAHREEILRLVPIGKPLVRFVGSEPSHAETVRVQAFFLHLYRNVIATVSFQTNIVTVSGIPRGIRGHAEIKTHFERWGQSYSARMSRKGRGSRGGQ